MNYSVGSSWSRLTKLKELHCPRAEVHTRDSVGVNRKTWRRENLGARERGDSSLGFVLICLGVIYHRRVVLPILPRVPLVVNLERNYHRSWALASRFANFSHRMMTHGAAVVATSNLVWVEQVDETRRRGESRR